MGITGIELGEYCQGSAKLLEAIEKNPVLVKSFNDCVNYYKHRQ